jgi:hypothetical protein
MISQRNIPRMLLLLAALVASACRVYAAEATTAQEPKQPCCRHDGGEIARLLKNADRLYGQFKPKEAVGELHKYSGSTDTILKR